MQRYTNTRKPQACKGGDLASTPGGPNSPPHCQHIVAVIRLSWFKKQSKPRRGASMLLCISMMASTAPHEPEATKVPFHHSSNGSQPPLQAPPASSRARMRDGPQQGHHTLTWQAGFVSSFIQKQFLFPWHTPRGAEMNLSSCCANRDL